MGLGVRSYGNSLYTQNVFNPDALSDSIPLIKAFGYRILRPEFTCVEMDCKTPIGRRVNIPEVDTVGLIDLETNFKITEQDVVDSLMDGVFTTRLRDTANCLTQRGFCAFCGNGFYARVGIDDSVGVGHKYTLLTSARSYQNYVAKTYSGSLLGFSPLTSDPLPAPDRNWTTITNHSEMNRLCDLLRSTKLPRDTLDYLYTIDNVLERALTIIGLYGVYGYA